MENLKKLYELISRAHRLGGKEEIEKHHKKGKKTIYERINYLVDENSFIERGILAGVYENDKFCPCPFRMGIATINKRKVAISGDDFTVKGASVGRLYKAKAAYFIKMARSLKIPAIRLVEGAGGSIKEILEIGHTELPSSGDECTQNRVEALSEIPIVSVAFGSAAGLAALHMVLSHFSIMLKDSYIFAGGPPLVKAASAKEYSKEELGGYKIHTEISGVIDNVAENEEDALNQVKKFLSYLPQNVWVMPEIAKSEDSPERIEPELSNMIPEDNRKVYNMRKILSLIFDKNSIFEIGKNYGKSQITALGRLNGFAVGILANNPLHLAGALNYDSAEKLERFVDLCNTFHLPVVNFVDQPGLMIGMESETHGTIRKAARASCALIQATVPISIVYVRKCYGVGGAIQKGGNRFTWRVAWPTANWGNIPIEGGVYAAHKKEINNSPNPDEYLKKLQEKYKKVTSPFKTAEAFNIEDIIDPKFTRPFLCQWVEMAYDIEKNNLGIKKRGIRC